MSVPTRANDFKHLEVVEHLNDKTTIRILVCGEYVLKC